MKTKQIFSAFTAFLILFAVPGVSSAAEMTFIKEYTYQAGKIDSEATSRAQALAQAKRLVLEELGTYLMSMTEVKDFGVSSGKLTALTDGVAQTEIFDEKWDGEKYYLKARIKADPGTVARAIGKLRNYEGRTRELEEAMRREDEMLKEIQRLKSDLGAAVDDLTKHLAYARRHASLSAAEWFDKGNAFVTSRDWDNAIEAYSMAVELDPGYAIAYNNRGIAHHNKGQFDKAVGDYDKAISLKPDYAPAYDNRGNAFERQGRYDRAIEDFDKVISLKPDYADAFYNRGNAFERQGLYDRAIEDFNMAISLKPDDADVFHSRGLAYSNKGRLDAAIKDFDIAISLKPDYVDAFYNRGLAYKRKGQTKKAIADYKKNCELGDNDGCEQVEQLKGVR